MAIKFAYENGVTFGESKKQIMDVTTIGKVARQVTGANRVVEETLPDAIISACYHIAHHGNKDPMITLVTAMSARAKYPSKYSAWVSAFTPVGFDYKSNKVWVSKKEGAEFDLNGLADTSPWDFEEDRSVDYGIDKLMNDLKKVAEGKKGKNTHVDEEAMAAAEVLVEALREYQLDKATEMSDLGTASPQAQASEAGKPLSH